MRIARPPFVAPFAVLAVFAAAAALGACSSHAGSAFVPSGAAFAAAAPKPTATPGELIVAPHSLKFTTVPTLVLRIREAKYHGTFHFQVAPPRFVKVSPPGKRGPNAKFEITSRATRPGIGILTVTDDHGGKKNVHVTVASGVIIIQ